jgi:thiosulfate reductase cytochrome b subunit
VAHFFALHMHQALALWGWLIVASGVRQPMRAVHFGAAVMLGWTAFTFVQALLGHPLIG